MNKAKTAGELSKIGKLITVLEKCNGKGTIGGSEALISPTAAKILAAVGVVFLTAVLAFAAYFVEPLIAPYITLRDVAGSLMLVLLLLSFVLSVKNIVSVLFTADDLPVLLPMPFSAGQIVTAKLTVSLKFPVTLSLVLVNAVFFGFGIRAGMGAAFYLGTVLSSVLIPVTGLALAAFLMVLIFRIFGFIRNRDVTVVLSGVFTLLLTIGYLVITGLDRDDSANTALNLLSSFAALSGSFPNIGFMSLFMFEGFVPGLLISIAVTAAVIALALLVIKLFYLTTALSMQNTVVSGKAVTRASLSGKKASALRALTAYESKAARRNPSYLVYGFAMTFIWPLFVALPLVFGKNSIFAKLEPPFEMSAAMLCALFLGITASCFACGFNILAGTAFSREGSSFSMLRTMPMAFADYYKSKRNFAMLICSLGSVAYILILGVVCTVIGFVAPASSWVFLFGALVSFLCNSILINSMLVSNAKKPVFNWDSETEISRKLGAVNIVALIVGFVMYIALFIGLIVGTLVDFTAVSLNGVALPAVIMIFAAAAALVILAVAVAVNKTSVKKAQKCLAEYE